MTCNVCGKCCSNSKLCPVSLAVSVGLTCMFGVFVMLMWSAHATGEAASYIQHMRAAMGEMPIWQVYLWVFLKGAFFGFFVALFYDLCRCLCNKMKGKKACGHDQGASCDIKK